MRGSFIIRGDTKFKTFATDDKTPVDIINFIRAGSIIRGELLISKFHIRANSKI